MVSRRFLVSLFVVFAAARSFAISYVVPADRLEIERASAIIIGRVLGSHVEVSRYGIETVTEVALEEALKGEAGSVVRVHEPGGVFGDIARTIPGVPTFTDGDRVLLLLYQREDGTYTVIDLQLGAFRITKDFAGREFALRDESELEGWDPNGQPHREQHRAAEPFLVYIRGIVRGEPAATDYAVASAPLKAINEAVHASTVYTASSYLLIYGSGLGTRWNSFPGAVNWNQGNVETGALGTGSSQISAAFAAWNAGGTNYVLKSANANPKGFLDPPDGVNNFVFERNLTSAGVQPFNCSSGGALGMGGMTSANFGAGAHFHNGEKFATTLEADVSMNQGLANCTTAQIPLEMFKSVIVHELGHSLGFRHSDQTRNLTANCATDPTLECSNGAIMNHILVAGLNGHLQQWDNTALSAVYGADAVCNAPSINTQPAGSTIVSGNLAQLSVTAIGTGPLSYQWFTGASGDVSSPVSGGTFAAISVSPATTTSYWVRVTGPCAPVANSNAVTVTVNVAGCAAVIANTPQVTQVSDGFQLSIAASGGSSFTYRWYQGSTPGVGPQVGSGNTLHVNPAVTTSYWCRVTNNCGNSAESVSAKVTVAACVAPQILGALADQTVTAGTSITLTVLFSGNGATITWFAGDVSTPVGTGATLTSEPLMQTTQFRARVTNACGSAETNVATITVTPVITRRRTARH
ncbi:MAG: hypothetical protein JWO97_3211 [Acidobacteria bacterium]|nr:hypothetical protein [Acidobacteriota bacterium]